MVDTPATQETVLTINGVTQLVALTQLVAIRRRISCERLNPNFRRFLIIIRGKNARSSFNKILKRIFDRFENIHNNRPHGLRE